jgi:hypothetical protein
MNNGYERIYVNLSEMANFFDAKPRLKPDFNFLKFFSSTISKETEKKGYSFKTMNELMKEFSF